MKTAGFNSELTVISNSRRVMDYYPTILSLPDSEPVATARFAAVHDAVGWTAEGVICRRLTRPDLGDHYQQRPANAAASSLLPKSCIVRCPTNWTPARQMATTPRAADRPDGRMVITAVPFSAHI